MNTERKGLLLITNGFPFGESEQSFLRAEFRELCNHFRVRVLSLGKKEPVLYSFPLDVQAENYSFPSLRTKTIPLRLLRLMHKEVLSELFHARKGCSAKLYLHRMKHILFAYLRAQAAADDLAQIVEDDHIDVIYTFWCTTMTLAAVLLKKRFPHLKVVTRFHGYDLYQERSAIGWQVFRPLIADKSDRLVFACRYGKNYFLNVWGKKYAEKSVLAYLGCGRKSPVTPADDGVLRIISCSNLIPLKRVDLIIEALSLLPKTMQVHWHHLGDGPEMDALQKQAHTLLASGENVQWKFWGYQPNNELESIYASIRPDVFITTSSTEGGVPVSIQEAFAMGIPAIGTAVGGIPDAVIDGKTGILLPADPTPFEVAEALCSFAETEPQQREAMGNAALALQHEMLDARVNAANFSAMLNAISEHRREDIPHE